MNSFSRLVIALLLTSSLRAGSVASFAQTNDKSKQQTQSTTQSTETAKADPNKDAGTKVPTTTPGSNKPLSVNEDPAMIGKRNINKGIIAKMSGSTEKEVKLGRELAAEVDPEAEILDDPGISGYVKRAW